MYISVVICTRNRAAALKRCLAALYTVDFEGTWEILVIDNNSSDNTQRIIAEMQQLCPVPFRSLVELVPGNSAGRNTAVDSAQGEVVFFTDDDCIVERTVLRELWRVFEDRRIGFAGGRILLFNPRDFPISLMEETKPIEIPPGTIVYPGLVQGSNMAFRRKALVELGGFDVLFGAGAAFAGEDLELATRASLRGWHGGYFPGPTVYHDHGRDRAKAMASERQYDFGIGAYYAKFLLNSTTRWICVLTWCRRSLKQLFRHPLGLHRQLAGAICYARLRGSHA